MKKSTLLAVCATVILFFGSIGNGWGQTNVFNMESMYNGTGGSSGDAISVHEANNRFENDALTMSGTGDMRTTSPSSGYTGASGTWNVMLNATSEYFQVAGVNTSSYTSLSLSFGIRKGSTAENGSTFSTQVSSDGSTWSSLTMPALPTGTGTATWYYRTCTGTIPSTSTLFIKFTSSSTTEFRIDDIVLTGTYGSVSAPTTQASNITFSSIGETGMTASWTNGDGAKRVVIMNTSNSFTNPVDGTDPTANTVYSGSGEQVVFNGTGNSVAVTGLTASTTYWFRVYEYNGTGATTKYLTTTATNNPNSQATTAPPPQIDWCNLQWPLTGTINLGDGFTVYAQVYEPGLTDAGGQGAGITAWIGYSTSNTDPSTWTNWVPATYNTDVGNNDEYMSNIGAAITATGTYYYASRFQLGTASYVYGGTGGFWTTGTSGVLTVNPANQLDWVNLQDPGSGNIEVGSLFDVYAQVYEPGITPGAGQGSNITAWIGYSTSNTNPNTWTNWVPAAYNASVTGNNDEYYADIASSLPAGTYYYASRFKFGLADYVYGGYSSGGGDFWDGTNYVSGVLTVTNPPAPNAWINEIHYDNSGTDANEFIEVVIENAGNYSLGNFNVYLYNGGNGQVYDTKSLSTFTQANTVGNFTFFSYTYPADGIQNGSPDGMALSYAGVLIPGQFLSYEGTFTGVGGVANGVTSTSIGVSEGTSTPTGSSLQLGGVGTGYSSFTWQTEMAHTKGALNTNQSFFTSTTWDGSESTDWNTAGNWNNGVPLAGTNVIIPDVSNDPTISTTASCKDLTINAGALLTVASGASLITSGTVTGSAVVERDITGGEWHFISSPVDGATSGIFTGKYLQWLSEPDYQYYDITSTTESLNIMQGYALFHTDNFTAAFSGTLNTGPQSIGVTKESWGWNLVGNPYPSAIDWNATGWTKTNVNNAVYIHINSSQWAEYVDGASANGGSQYIAPCQGFLVEANAPTGSLGMTNAVRVHNSATFFKSTNIINNLVRLEVSGNGYKDEAVIRINPLSTTTFDGNFDARKFYGSVDEAAQIYSFGDSPMAISSIPEAMPVSVGLHAGASGTYTIAATEINDLTNVKLEDTKTGIITSLAEKSYTFNWEAGENENRFILRFAAVGTPELEEEISSIYSYDKTAIIELPVNMRGDIFIYNLAGQPVASKASATGQVRINLSPAGVYVVKVVTDKETLTKKVWIR